MKKMIMATICIGGLLLGGCSTKPVEQVEETTATTTKSEVIESLEEEQWTQSDKEDVVADYLTMNLPSFDIDFNKEDRIIRVTAIEKEAMLVLVDIETDPEVAENWDIIAENFKTISKTIKDLLGSGYIINFVNPYDDERTLLVVLDGEIHYNFTEDL